MSCSQYDESFTRWSAPPVATIQSTDDKIKESMTTINIHLNKIINIIKKQGYNEIKLETIEELEHNINLVSTTNKYLHDVLTDE